MHLCSGLASSLLLLRRLDDLRGPDRATGQLLQGCIATLTACDWWQVAGSWGRGMARRFSS